MAIYPEYNVVQHYPAEKTIGFTAVDAEWGIFSNFAKTPMVVNGIEFKCVEQLYQYIRINSSEEREKYLKTNLGMRLKMTAKTFKHRGIEREDWLENAVDIMRFCLNHKYANSAEFRTELERSKDFYIIEDQTSRSKKTPDSWGAKPDAEKGEYYGKNIMGRLLMELRENGYLPYNHFEF